jgi:hypothetical protein
MRHADRLLHRTRTGEFIRSAGEGTAMSIEWRHDADHALEQARREGRWVLLDFSAAPT